MQKHYPLPMEKPGKFKETLAHLMKLFRYANKTNIDVGAEPTCNEFFFEKADSARPLLSFTGSKDDTMDVYSKSKLQTDQPPEKVPNSLVFYSNSRRMLARPKKHQRGISLITR